MAPTFERLGSIKVDLLLKTIGIIGIAFPLVLLLGALMAPGVDMQPSMSRFYVTRMHDVFVAFLCAIAVGLFAYRGYRAVGHRSWENWVASIAAGFAVGVAIFPPVSPSEIDCCYLPLLPWLGETAKFLHLGCAVLFIAILIWFVLCRFIMSPTPWKRATFRFCGSVMIVGFAIAVVSYLTREHLNYEILPNGVFWGEAVVVWFFGIAWFVKGR